MKTVIFYSFKGGQGRTTTLANIASCLYRLGHKVVMLDLDLECPGLPAKFGISLSDERGPVAMKGGIVDYLIDSMRSGRCSPEPLQRRVVQLPLGEEPSFAGSLSLIATGP